MFPPLAVSGKPCPFFRQGRLSQMRISAEYRLSCPRRGQYAACRAAMPEGRHDFASGGEAVIMLAMSG
ncbi:hypothetical protein CYR52_18925 [Chimaeribacter arupi]|nr:hypothetical protein CYR52_18925 [Chimaeribacter arupi]